MNCPICQYPGISESTKVCPKCSSDMSFLDDIKQVSLRIKKRNNILILVFILLIITAFIALYALSNFSNSGNKDNQLIEQLKKDNENLQKTVSDLTTKLNEVELTDAKTDTLKTVVNTEDVEYIVQKDDNLWIIAQKFYGDGHQFRKIALDNNLKKPYQIFIGTKLIIKK